MTQVSVCGTVVYTAVQTDDPVLRNVVVCHRNGPRRLVIPGYRVAHCKYIEGIRVATQVHHPAIILIVINIVVVDGFIEQTIYRVWAEIKLNTNGRVFGIHAAQLFKHSRLAQAAVAFGISYKVKMYRDVFDTISFGNRNVARFDALNMFGGPDAQLFRIFKRNAAGFRLGVLTLYLYGNKRQNSQQKTSFFHLTVKFVDLKNRPAKILFGSGSVRLYLTIQEVFATKGCIVLSIDTGRTAVVIISNLIETA